MAILEVQNIEKSFDRTPVLKDISFSLEQGQALAIIGSSGSGKTTLLRCLNFLEKPDKGKIVVQGETLFDAEDATSVKEKDIRMKRLHFGMVFQAFHLFPQYTALQNVMLARQLLEKGKPGFKENKKKIYEEIEAEAKELLDKMGLSDRMQHYPHQLSGGQQQRVAIARALALKPDILCFDEPTSALDPELTGEVLKVLCACHISCGGSGYLYGQWSDRGAGRRKAGDRESTGRENKTIPVKIFAGDIVSFK